MSKHPSQATLALFVSNDLGLIARWRAERHLESCGDCRSELSDFSTLRVDIESAQELPDVQWTRLAAEMKANIRLGLAAGECVSRSRIPGIHLNLRAVAACASLAVLLAVGFFLERPAPRLTAAQGSSEPVVLEASHNGIQVTEGAQSMMLLNTRAHDVNVVASGSTMRARYIDAETGYVTINNVYVQ
jgi:hypothetical protein